MVFFDKNSIHSFINGLHHPFGDTFFKLASHSVETYGIIILLLVAFLINVRTFLITGLSIAIAGGLVQYLKRVVFYGFKRPSVYFSELTNFHTLEGVDLHTVMSFPSGHTTAAFCLFFGLATGVKNKSVQSLLFVAALLVGYSRMYLSQHYLRDVLAGSLIAVVITLLLFLLFAKSNAKWLGYRVFRK